MTAPMPKDNEVDEKVMPIAWWVPNARACQDGSWEEGPGYLKFADETDGAERKYGTAIYSAATVAELRAEVERLHFELDMLRGNYEQQTAYTIIHKGALRYCNSSMRDAYSDETARADAAERRVRELVEAIWEYRLFASCANRDAIARIDALTGADPT